jgi:uncharacterized protein (DUF697 family)
MKKTFGLPIDLKQIGKMLTGINDESLKPLYLEVLVDASASPELLQAAERALQPRSDALRLTLETYGKESAQIALSADLSLILAASSPLTAETQLRALAQGRPAVILSDDVAALKAAWPKTGAELDADLAVLLPQKKLAEKGADGLFEAFGEWLSSELPSTALAWARALDCVRRAQSQAVIRNNSLENALISTAVFLPGADMPLLLANQIRMFLHLVALHGQELDSKRYRELAVILLSGFGFRAISRKLVSLLPAVGWAIKGSVSYGATTALGQAAEIYLNHLKPADSSADSSADTTTGTAADATAGSSASPSADSTTVQQPALPKAVIS